MKHLLLLLSALLTAGTLSAQTLYVSSGGGIGLVVEGNDGTNPTLYVEGGVELDGPAVVEENAGNDGGDMRVVDFSAANRGSVTIDAGELEHTGESTIQLEGHWTNNQVYDASLTAGRAPTVIFNGTLVQNYEHSGSDYDFQNVSFQNTLAVGAAAGSIVMNSDLAVTNEAIFAGVANQNVVNASGNTFIMGPNATFTNAYLAAGGTPTKRDYINGTVRRHTNFPGTTTYDFPTGNTASAEPMQIAFSGNPGNVTHIDGSFDAAAPPGLVAGATQETWLCGNPTMDPFTGTWEWTANDGSTYLGANGTLQAGVGSGTYGVVMRPHTTSATPAANTVAVSSTAQNASGTNGGGAWRVVNTGVAAADGNFPCVPQGGAPNELATSQRLTGFSEGGGHFAPAPLPVEFLGLTATPDDEGFIYVNWQTLTETNNSHFNLFRSTDNQNFEIVKDEIPGAGTTKDPQSYSYDDYDVEFNQVYYYKTQQVDYDGQSSFSNVAQAMLTRDALGAESSVVLYPNPTDGTLNMRVASASEQTIGIKIYDAIGKLIVDEIYDVQPGISTVDLTSEIGDVSAGAYNAVVNMSANTFTTKLVITK